MGQWARRSFKKHNMKKILLAICVMVMGWVSCNKETDLYATLVAPRRSPKTVPKTLGDRENIGNVPRDITHPKTLPKTLGDRETIGNVPRDITNSPICTIGANWKDRGDYLPLIGFSPLLSGEIFYKNSDIWQVMPDTLLIMSCKTGQIATNPSWLGILNPWAYGGPYELSERQAFADSSSAGSICPLKMLATLAELQVVDSLLVAEGVSFGGPKKWSVTTQKVTNLTPTTFVVGADTFVVQQNGDLLSSSDITLPGGYEKTYSFTAMGSTTQYYGISHIWSGHWLIKR